MSSARPSMAATEPETLRFEIAKLELAPGDCLVVRVPVFLTEPGQGERLVDYIRRTTGITRSVRVLLIDQSVELSVLTQADIEKAAR